MRSKKHEGFFICEKEIVEKIEYMFYYINNKIATTKNDISEMEDLLWRRKK